MYLANSAEFELRLWLYYSRYKNNPHLVLAVCMLLCIVKDNRYGRQEEHRMLKPPNTKKLSCLKTRGGS